MHDRNLLDALAALPTETYVGKVYRATRESLDPFATSTFGGRWSKPDGQAVLYTCLDWLGALKELAYHWNLQTPPLSKPIVVHTLRIQTERTLRLLRTNFPALGLQATELNQFEMRRTQEIGEAVAFLDFDGLIVPSARHPCDNLIVFQANSGSSYGLFALEKSEKLENEVWQERVRDQE